MRACDELVTILRGSLADVEDRWCEGKGPLAMVMTPDTVNALLRALFQNTNARKALIVKIRDTL